MAGEHLQPDGGAPAYMSSTEHLNSVKGEGDAAARGLTAQAKRKKLILWISATVLLVLVAAGVTVGVLASQGVISTSSSSSGSVSASEADTAADVDTNSQSESESGLTLTPTTTSKSVSSSSSASATSSASSSETSESCPTEEDIPKDSRGTDLDTSSWLDMTDFNCTFTDETVGDLPLAGLFIKWDDSARANPNVPALDKSWASYSEQPFRGVNVGGWLSIEPFITPSLFEYPEDLGIVDEWTLCEHLGPKASSTLEKHYATFITEDDFKAIAAAGLDHVRIPFSYWAVETYDDDPYVPRLSWRYLLRGIEWARKHGIRVKLDLHGLPGSQNGWNHSGRSGSIGFLKGSKGDVNGQRALDIHDRLTKFFAQDRYKNVVAFYGLGNEPGLSLDQDKVKEWTNKAYNIGRDNGLKAPQVFSDGLQGLAAWEGQFPGLGDTLVVDAHQYTIFDVNLISLKHKDRIKFGCEVFAEQSADSMRGFGPTMVGEWSQAHTDCTRHLNGVGSGNRWTGTFADVTSPSCPTKDERCSCEVSNDESQFSDEYKEFIQTWAIAQMDAYEKSWGWFYWTWKTESAPLWSYKHGLDGGFMPKKAYDRGWSCSEAIPDFGDLPEYT